MPLPRKKQGLYLGLFKYKKTEIETPNPDLCHKVCNYASIKYIRGSRYLYCENLIDH